MYSELAVSAQRAELYIRMHTCLHTSAHTLPREYLDFEFYSYQILY